MAEAQNPLQASETARPPVLALTPREAAAALGISERTLFTWSKERGLPFVKVDRTVRYPVDGLRIWLAEEAGRGGWDDPGTTKPRKPGQRPAGRFKGFT